MASVNKQKKAKNSFCASALKQGLGRLKRIFFYDAAQRKRAKKAVFDVWKVEDLGLDAASVGTSGSATKVTELFAPEPNPVGVMIEGATPADAAANLVKDLTAKNLL